MTEQQEKVLNFVAETDIDLMREQSRLMKKLFESDENRALVAAMCEGEDGFIEGVANFLDNFLDMTGQTPEFP